MSFDYEQDRKQSVENILQAKSPRRLIIAGPGTGKTYLFQKICERSKQSILAITFINNLANDLERELGDSAECCTFHALCKKLIYQLPVSGIDTFYYFPKIDVIIESDRAILEPQLGPIRVAFEEFSTEDVRVEFFLKRSHYYQAIGHTDGVFQVVQYLRSVPDKIPRYNQILVDEYQDFNRLEVEMISTLGSVNATLIVGDDDQALYDFKHASPDFLRSLCQDSSVERFELPYCSRCTEVIVAATNQIFDHAMLRGFLKGRINKPFKCYVPGKGEDSQRYPKLIHVTCSVQKANAPYISRFIHYEISRIIESGYRPEYESGIWDFIIAGAGHYIRGLVDILKQDFPNTFFSKREPDVLEIHDCYLELLRDKGSQIGWRGLLNYCDRHILHEIVEKSRSMEKQIRDLISQAMREDVDHTIDTLGRLKEGKTINAFEETKLIGLFKENLDSVKRRFGFVDTPDERPDGNRKHRIRISSILGCKGLTANFVFLVGLNNGVLPKEPNAPTDYEICKFIVGMTRARKKCYLISARNLFGEWLEESDFLNWIDDSMLENIYVNKSYFK